MNLRTVVLNASSAGAASSPNERVILTPLWRLNWVVPGGCGVRLPNGSRTTEASRANAADSGLLIGPPAARTPLGASHITLRHRPLAACRSRFSDPPGSAGGPSGARQKTVRFRTATVRVARGSSISLVEHWRGHTLLSAAIGASSVPWTSYGSGALFPRACRTYGPRVRDSRRRPSAPPCALPPLRCMRPTEAS